MSLPRWLVWAAVGAVVLSFLPLALIARARAARSERPRFHLVLDMDDQPSFRPQEPNPLFADHRAMRPQVASTVAREQLEADDALYRGKVGETWVSAIPLPVDLAVLRRGQERFNVYCSPCHGLAGYGDGMVAKRAEALEEGTWTPPSSLHTDQVRGRQDGQLFDTVSNGVRNMPAYGPQVEVSDRWAIVAYVRALQRSQGASLADVPADRRERLR